MRKLEIVILCVGLMLPFIGDILGAMQQGVFPFYVHLPLIFVMEVFNLIPIIVCLMYYRGTAANLKRFRYAPIIVTYLFIIYCHCNAVMVVMSIKGPTAQALTLAFAVFGIPFAALLVFVIALVGVLLVNLPTLMAQARENRALTIHDRGVVVVKSDGDSDDTKQDNDCVG